MPTVTEQHDFEGVPKEFDGALGTLTRRFGQVEHLLAAIIKRTTDDNWDDTLARLGGDLKKRDKMLCEVRKCFIKWAESTFDVKEARERTGKFDKIRNDLQAALQTRDELTHCAWGVDPCGHVRGTRHGQPLLIENRPAGQEHIERVTDELWVCFKVLNIISRKPRPAATTRLEDYLIQTDPQECSVTAASCWGLSGFVEDI